MVKSALPGPSRLSEFIPFVCSTDFCLSAPAEALLTDLADDAYKRWSTTTKGLCVSWMRTPIALGIARGASVCVRGRLGRQQGGAAHAVAPETMTGEMAAAAFTTR